MFLLSMYSTKYCRVILLVGQYHGHEDMQEKQAEYFVYQRYPKQRLPPSGGAMIMTVGGVTLTVITVATCALAVRPEIIYTNGDKNTYSVSLQRNQPARCFRHGATYAPAVASPMMSLQRLWKTIGLGTAVPRSLFSQVFDLPRKRFDGLMAVGWRSRKKPDLFQQFRLCVYGRGGRI